MRIDRVDVKYKENVLDWRSHWSKIMKKLGAQE